MCLQQVQGSSASEHRQVYADVPVFWDVSGIPPTKPRPPPGHSQSHQHNDDDYVSNTSAINTVNTNTTMINTADTTTATASTSSFTPNLLYLQIQTGHQAEL